MGVCGKGLVLGVGCVGWGVFRGSLCEKRPGTALCQLLNGLTLHKSWAHQHIWWHLCENIFQNRQKTPQRERKREQKGMRDSSGNTKVRSGGELGGGGRGAPEQTYTEACEGPHARADEYFLKDCSPWESPCQSRGKVWKGRCSREKPLCTFYNPSIPPVLVG